MDSDLKVEIIEGQLQPTDETFPQIRKALIEKLELIFKDCCPELNTAEREIWFKVGQVSVVKYLRVEHERQQNKG